MPAPTMTTSAVAGRVAAIEKVARRRGAGHVTWLRRRGSAATRSPRRTGLSGGRAVGTPACRRSIEAGEGLEAVLALARPGQRAGPALDHLRVDVAGGAARRGPPMRGRPRRSRRARRAQLAWARRARCSPRDRSETMGGVTPGVASAAAGAPATWRARARRPLARSRRLPARSPRSRGRPAAPPTTNRETTDVRPNGSQTGSSVAPRRATAAPAARPRSRFGLRSPKTTRSTDTRRRPAASRMTAPVTPRSPVTDTSAAVGTGPATTDAPAPRRRSPAATSSGPSPTSSARSPGRIPWRTARPRNVPP